MPADEVTDGTDVDASRARTGPRHAAPRKPLFTRFHMPAGKAMALAAMPTAVFMGVGINTAFARADDHSPAKSMSVDEYQKCVEALDPQDSKDASASPSPSASASASESADAPDPTSSASADKPSDGTPGKTSSSDSGSDDEGTPKPSTSSTGASGGGTSTPDPSASEGGGLLGTIGDTLSGVLGGSHSGSSSSSSTSSAPSASASATKDSSLSGAVKDTTKKVTDTVNDTVKDTTDTAGKAVSEVTKSADDAVKSVASAAGTPSPGSTELPDDCVAATDDEGGVEKITALPDAPWHLQASSLLLKGADYQGVVKVRTANGTVKKVLKYVISNGTDIGDLHQLVDGQKGETYHVQAAKGSTSTIRDGKTVMYTESISGNLLGLIPVTFSPDSPPPLNIPIIYFTNVKVTQAGQFGGTLTVPGMHQYVTGG
ncbi:hypothetical protein [Streptomyces sp. NPDC057072]|uniref:hypothetical protein n=1 Tax=Streptomyces sp. NPDC057072 TaxID=3346014 RepID=UPI00362D9E05